MIAKDTYPDLNPFSNPLYYSAVFELLMNRLFESYGPWVNQEYQDFHAAYHKLDHEARLLLARCHFRSGPYIRLSALNYTEIKNLPAAVATLQRHGFLQKASVCAGSLACLRVKELKDLARPLGQSLGANLRKEDLIDLLEDHVHADQWAALDVHAKKLAEFTDVAQAFYFGDFSSNVFDFIRGDVLNLQHESFQSCFEMAYRFETQKQFDDALSFISLRVRMYEAQAEGDEAELHAAAAGFLDLELPDERLQRRRSRYLYKIGHALERLAEDSERRDSAYRILAHSDDYRAQQKCLRHWLKTGKHAFVQEFFVRAGDRVARDPQWNKFLPSFLKAAAKAGLCLQVEKRWDLPQCTYNLKKDGGVEDNLCGFFHEQGLEAYHFENDLIRVLFALYFWDLIFAPVPGAFRHPFQTGPDDLFEGDLFYKNRRDLCDTRLHEIETGRMGLPQVLLRLNEKADHMNPLASLGDFDPEILTSVIQGLRGPQLAAMFRLLLKDVRTMSAGFPDLVVIDRTRNLCRFVEVKGPGDTLRPVQIEWLEGLLQAGIDAHMGRVVYR